MPFTLALLLLRKQFDTVARGNGASGETGFAG